MWGWIFAKGSADIVTHDISRNNFSHCQLKTRQLHSKINVPSSESTNANSVRRIDNTLPRRSTTDACHIAVATVNDLDIILSLNFEHIVRRKTVLQTGSLNAQLGYRQVDIRSPMEVVDRENS